MVFRKKKVMEEQPSEVIEVSDDDMDIEEDTQPQRRSPLSLPMDNFKQRVPEPPPKPKQVTGMARIISGELIETEGKVYHRYILLTNKSLGMIGEEIPID